MLKNVNLNLIVIDIIKLYYYLKIKFLKIIIYKLKNNIFNLNYFILNIIK